VALGFDASAKGGLATRNAPAPPSSEAPTGAAPGRALRGDPPPAPREDESAARREEEAAPPPKPKRRTWALVFAVAIALAAISALAKLRDESAPATPVDPRVAPSGAIDAAGGGTVAVLTEASSPTPTAAASASAEPPLGTEIDASEARHGSSPPPIVRPKAGPPDARTTAAPALNCNPPYTVGPAPDFIRRPKLECLPP
jgi:hypothetical protein